MKALSPLLLLLFVSLGSSAPTDGFSDFPNLRSYFDPDTFDYESLLSFDLENSPELEPFVSLACAGLDAFKIFIAPPKSGFSEKIETLRQSVCSGLSSSDRVDMRFLKKCMVDASCLAKFRQEHLLGMTPDNEFFYYFNMTELPRKAVSECAGDDSCEHKAEAVKLMDKWESIIENCEREDEDRVVDAIHGIREQHHSKRQPGGSQHRRAGRGARKSGMSPYDSIELKQSKCMKRTTSPKVKRTIVKSMDQSAVCTKEVMQHMMEYMASDEDAPMDATMDLTRKLMRCDNASVPAMMMNMLDEQNQDTFKAGYAIYEAMGMMEEEEMFLRARRHASDNRHHEGHERSSRFSNLHLLNKWANGPLIWKFSYTPDEKTNAWLRDAMYRAVIIVSEDGSQPLTVKLTETYSYPPVHNELTIALETELLETIMQIMSVQFNSVHEIFAFGQKILSDQGVFAPFKLSAVLTYDDYNYEMEEFQLLAMQLYEKFLAILETTNSMSPSYYFKLSNIGGTEGNFFLSAQFPDSNTFKLEATAKTPGNKDLLIAFLDLEKTKSGQDNAGFEISGGLDLLSGVQVYYFNGYYSPVTEFTSADRTCEHFFEILDSTYKHKFFTWSGCIRPMYMMDPTEFLEPFSSLYYLLEIPNYAKLNFTLDFGENGLFGFMGSPKFLNILLEHVDYPLAEFDMHLRVLPIESQGPNAPMLKTETSVRLNLNVIDAEASMLLGSEVFDDLSAKNSYRLDMKSGTESDSLSGVLDITSCSRNADGLLNKMMMGAGVDLVPERICYDIYLQLPRDLGYIEQTIKYNSQNGNLKYHVTSTLEVYGMPMAQTTNYESRNEVWTLETNVQPPLPVKMMLTNKEFDSVPFKDKSEVQMFLSTESGAILILNSSVPWVGQTFQPFVAAFSTLHEKQLLKDLHGNDVNFAVCSYKSEQHYFDKLRCFSQCMSGDEAYLDLAFGRIEASIKSPRHGKLGVFANLTQSTVEMYNRNMTLFGNMSLKYNNWEPATITSFFKPMAAANSTLCEVMNYNFENGEIYSNQSCIQQVMAGVQLPPEAKTWIDFMAGMDPNDVYAMVVEYVDVNLQTFSAHSFKVLLTSLFDTLMTYISPYLF